MTVVILQQLGLQAEARGYSSTTAEKEYKMTEDTSLLILRQIRETWHYVDGTVPRGDHDDKLRYNMGPRWFKNSCAIDSALFCAIMLDAGRIQVDQISPAQLACLGQPAGALRRIVSKPWGVLSQTQRDGLRDVLADALTHTDPRRFPRHSPHSIDEVLKICFDRLPQLSFTGVKAHICCNDELTIKGSQSATREIGFYLQRPRENMSVQDVLQSMLSRRAPKHKIPCDDSGCCTGPRFSIRLILDRMPPILLTYALAPISEKENKTFQLFKRLELIYYTTRGEQTIRYSPLGCVIILDWGHFVVRWRTVEDGQEQIIHYDGMTSSKATKVKGWWAGLGSCARSTKMGSRSGSGVVAAFYRKV